MHFGAYYSGGWRIDRGISALSGSWQRFQGLTTISVKAVEVVWPAEFTITNGLVVPGMAVVPALKVRLPEGFVSEAA